MKTSIVVHNVKRQGFFLDTKRGIKRKRQEVMYCLYNNQSITIKEKENQVRNNEFSFKWFPLDYIVFFTY